MPFCIQCECHYADGVTICPDCQVALVELPAISAAAVTPDRSWVRVWGVRTNNRAERAKTALDSHNIPSVIMASSFAGRELPRPEYAALASNPSELTIIMVPREFREEAEIVLEAALWDDAGQLDI